VRAFLEGGAASLGVSGGNAPHIGQAAGTPLKPRAWPPCDGGKHPRAVNKADVSAAEDVPVQNGKALFSIEVTATFTQDCTPPMTVDFTDISVCDTTNGICCTL
jgi:hypothetical protein